MFHEGEECFLTVIVPPIARLTGPTVPAALHEGLLFVLLVTGFGRQPQSLTSRRQILISRQTREAVGSPDCLLRQLVHETKDFQLRSR